LLHNVGYTRDAGLLCTLYSM